MSVEEVLDLRAGFLNGTILLEIKSEDESNFIIELSKAKKFNVEFEVDTYLEYPYYLIEGQEQLNATKSLIGWEKEYTKIAKFNEIFENDLKKYRTEGVVTDEIYGVDLERFGFIVKGEEFEKLLKLQNENKNICVESKVNETLIFITEEGFIFYKVKDARKDTKEAFSIGYIKEMEDYIFDGVYQSIWRDLELEFPGFDFYNEIYASLNKKLDMIIGNIEWENIKAV